MKLICPKCSKIIESTLIMKYLQVECNICGSVMLKEESKDGERVIEQISGVEPKVVKQESVTRALRKIIFEQDGDSLKEYEIKKKPIGRMKITRLKLIIPLVFGALIAFSLYFIDRLHFDELKFKAPERDIVFLYFSLDSLKIHALTKSGLLRTWDIKNNKQDGKDIEIAKGAKVGHDFLSNKKYEALAYPDGTIKIFSDKFERTFQEHKTGLMYFDFVPGLPIIFAIDRDFYATAYNFLDGEIVYKTNLLKKFPEEDITSWATNAEQLNVGINVRLAVGYSDGRIKIYSVTNIPKPYEIQPTSTPITAVAFSQHSSIIGYGTKEGVISIIQLESGENKFSTKVEFVGCESAVTALAFSPDNRLIVAGDANGNVSIWILSSLAKSERQKFRKPYRIMKAHKKEVNLVTFSVTGDILASAGKDGYVRIWFVGM